MKSGGQGHSAVSDQNVYVTKQRTASEKTSKEQVSKGLAYRKQKRRKHFKTASDGRQSG